MKILAAFTRLHVNPLFFSSLKEDILRNGIVVFVHKVKVTGHQNCLVTNILLLLYSQKRESHIGL